ncbi:hypothetical protein Sjap_023393 [Stephania japonica]|uniref:Cytochrome P450 n=1 Tax=Stephania japonica TaxID=461633 RepID=A0AAP0EBI4_9MAGN
MTSTALEVTSVTISVISGSCIVLVTVLAYLLRVGRGSVKGLRRLPIVGHLHHILLSPSPPHHTLAQLSGLHGPLLHLRLGQVPTVLLSSPRLARLALKSPLDHHLSSRPRLLSSHHLSFSSSDLTFSPSGPYWRQARRLCLSHLLSPQKLPQFQQLRLRQVDRMLSAILRTASLAAEADTDTDTDMDMSAVFLELANDVLCRVAFGRRFAAGGRLAEVLEETQRLFGGFCVGDFYPGMEWVGWVTGLRWRLWRNLRDLRTVCDEIINQHLHKGDDVGDVGGEHAQEDFLDVLLRDMFVAGTDTTATTLEWAMTELVRHPTILAKAQAEVRSMVTTTNTTTPQVSDLHHLKYMKAIIKETFRLHPPAPLLVPRESISECTIEGFKIPPKTRILINAYAIGRDPETWVEPLEFKPERFKGNENIDVKGNEFELIPFGGGRRGCPGYSFGLATIEIALARLLCHFDWSLVDGVKPEDVDMSEIFGLATRKKVPLVLVPRVNKEFEWKGEA